LTDRKAQFPTARAATSSLLTRRFSRHPERYWEIVSVFRKYESHVRVGGVLPAARAAWRILTRDSSASPTANRITSDRMATR
jgi:hypothetical protein